MASSQATQYTFPAPVGGVPFDVDFGPSLLFVVLYTLLFFLACYRMVMPASRIYCIPGTLVFVIERRAIFSSMCLPY